MTCHSVLAVPRGAEVFELRGTETVKRGRVAPSRLRQHGISTWW